MTYETTVDAMEGMRVDEMGGDETYGDGGDAGMDTVVEELGHVGLDTYKDEVEVLNGVVEEADDTYGDDTSYVTITYEPG